MIQRTQCVSSLRGILSPGEGCKTHILSTQGSSRNEPFGSRPEPGVYLIASILQLPPGEVPEGKAGVRVQAEAPARERTQRPQRETGVTVKSYS